MTATPQNAVKTLNPEGEEQFEGNPMMAAYGAMRIVKAADGTKAMTPVVSRTMESTERVKC